MKKSKTRQRISAIAGFLTLVGDNGL